MLVVRPHDGVSDTLFVDSAGRPNLTESDRDTVVATIVDGLDRNPAQADDNAISDSFGTASGES